MRTSRKGRGELEGVTAPSRIADLDGRGSAIEEKVKAKREPKAKREQMIAIPELDISIIKIRIIGDSALISNRKSEEAASKILQKQMQVATAGKEVRDPEADYERSLYPHPDGGWAFPSQGLKNAAVSACTSLPRGGITKKAASQSHHMVGDWVKIDGEPRKRQDLVRVMRGGADVRFRAEFPTWSCILTIRYNARMISAQQLCNLYNLAGFAVGIGDWRPERSGNHGMFHVEIQGKEAQS